MFDFMEITMKLEHWDTTRDGELSERAMRHRLVALGYRVNKYVYPPGTVFGDHSHAVDKIDGVLAGRFRMRMQGASIVLEAGDLLWVQKNVVHSAEVVGSEAVVSLDAICA
jgi:quercetin dioxygenase-like cupin family protein